MRMDPAELTAPLPPLHPKAIRPDLLARLFIRKA
jgi:hypothetical protein